MLQFGVTIELAFLLLLAYLRLYSIHRHNYHKITGSFEMKSMVPVTLNEVSIQCNLIDMCELRGSASFECRVPNIEA